jgi:TonB family protein
VEQKRTVPKPPPPPPPPALPADYQRALDELKPIQIPKGGKGPVLTYEVKPIYPPEAKAMQTQGTVEMEAIIDTHGRVVSARVVNSIPELDQAALDALKQWQFQPALLNGEPVSVICNVEMSFKLK